MVSQKREEAPALVKPQGIKFSEGSHGFSLAQHPRGARECISNITPVANEPISEGLHRVGLRHPCQEGQGNTALLGREELSSSATRLIVTVMNTKYGCQYKIAIKDQKQYIVLPGLETVQQQIGRFNCT